MIPESIPIPWVRSTDTFASHIEKRKNAGTQDRYTLQALATSCEPFPERSQSPILSDGLIPIAFIHCTGPHVPVSL